MIMGRVSQTAAVVALGLLVLGFMFHAGPRVNVTRSIPIGLYRVTEAPLGKGEYVVFCPPESALFDEARERGYIGRVFAREATAI